MQKLIYLEEKPESEIGTEVLQCCQKLPLFLHDIHYFSCQILCSQTQFLSLNQVLTKDENLATSDGVSDLGQQNPWLVPLLFFHPF